MFAQSLTFLVLAAVAVSSAAIPTEADKKELVIDVFRSMEGVDPNTLSCDPEGLIFLLLPHFTDCSKFYMCNHGNENEFSCAAGTLFDFELQGCDHYWRVNCTLRIEEFDIEGSGMEPGDDILGVYGEEAENGPLSLLTAESSGTVRPVSAVKAQQFNNVLNCNRADEASRMVPYQSDCQRYWKCAAGVPQVAYCSDGLFFNSRTQQCDFEANALCAIDPVDELTGEFIVYE